MSDVLLRGLPDDELTELKAAAAEAQQSLQRYLRDEVLHAHVVYLRRIRALDAIEQRIAGRRPIPDAAREAAFRAVDDELESMA